MKKIINKKMYDTDKALLLAEYWNGLDRNDFRNISEDLYITNKGQFFLHCSGGALTEYSETNGKNSWGSQTFIVLNKDETYKWLEKNNEVEVIATYFADNIEEA